MSECTGRPDFVYDLCDIYAVGDCYDFQLFYTCTYENALKNGSDCYIQKLTEIHVQMAYLHMFVWLYFDVPVYNQTVKSHLGELTFC